MTEPTLTIAILTTLVLSGFTGLAIGYVMGRNGKGMRKEARE